MGFKKSFLTILSITFFFNVCSSTPILSQHESIRFGARSPFLRSRDVTSDPSVIDGQTFDYIIVGGGLAGLTVANRISEDSKYSVLVIEAGPDIYGQDQNKFLVPAGNLYNSAVGTSYDWQWQTNSQQNLNNRQLSWPRGKVLGGSSSVNGLYMVRASKIEHDAWANLNNAQDRWNWDQMLAAMKKSENFQGPTSQVQQTVPDLQWNTSSHGQEGPVHTGWSAISYPEVEAFLQGNQQSGIILNGDPDGGESWGSFVATSCIDNSNWQRSSSRTAYLNGVDQRSNLKVLTGNQVTKVLTNTTESSGSKLQATGVQYARYDGDQIRTVNARREVILSGGAINSPMLLQLSGIGDAQQLQNVGIQSVIDLPGVGHNVQDHLSWSIMYSPASGESMPPQSVTGDPKTDSFVNSATSYVNTTILFGEEGAQQLIQSVKSSLPQMINSANVRDEVKNAYNVTMNTQLDDVFNSSIGPIEILHALTFGTVQLQVALQHPLSRGSILINSQNPFASPTIDPGYLSADVDLQMLTAGFKLARKIGQTEAMAKTVGQELAPGSGVQSDSDWQNYIRNNVQTEYHPSSGCGMLPREQGGVVDPNLIVYGTNNLRVIDSSVPPLAVSAHLMTIVYGLAEIGSEIVIEARTPPSNNQTGSNSTNGTNSTDSSNSNGGKLTKANNAQNLKSSSLISLTAAVILATFMLL